ncbi:BnaAnng39030D [Brassica napus]|uniref:BnaAnng39030D protein n=1 Tax=Brassica napus TaxID=3708 RepID=A0A078JYU9_BRANA|nr:BnaAnng39030D [Brassica napus]
MTPFLKSSRYSLTRIPW